MNVRVPHPSRVLCERVGILTSELVFTLRKYNPCATLGTKPRTGAIKLQGIAFQDAIRIFEGPTLERLDDRFDYGEDRIYAIGLVNGLEITLIYVDKQSNERRIISAWRSEPHERRRYWQSFEAQ